jgi:hypothetical protein
MSRVTMFQTQLTSSRNAKLLFTFRPSANPQAPMSPILFFHCKQRGCHALQCRITKLRLSCCNKNKGKAIKKKTAVNLQDSATAECSSL